MIAFVVATLSVVACSTSDNAPAVQCKHDTDCTGDKECDDGKCVAPEDSSTSTGSGGTSDAGSGDDVCKRYLACTYAVAPEQAPGAEMAYGTNGSCWSAESADVCREGCTTALHALHELDASTACAECVADADCGGATPACDTAKGECVACTTDANCHEPTSHCDVATRQCVPPACVSKGCGDVKCGTAVDNCGTTIVCGDCVSANPCMDSECVTDHCVNTPVADFNTCATVSGPGACLNGACGTLNAACYKKGDQAYHWYSATGPSSSYIWSCGCSNMGIFAEDDLNDPYSSTCSKCLEDTVSVDNYGSFFCFQ